ncbi:hypothetical protein BDR06DRAFT_1063563 [Suillus hirtellus]|nr:hypothetical protein BDR06DRAFT_1063563 [Suillus hirtellus]
MSPVHPQNASSSSKAPGGQAIKEEENTERAVSRFTRSSSESDVETIQVVHVDHQIHAQDIAHFAHFRYDEHVKQLAKSSCFQTTLIHNVYKHVSSFKQTEKVIKAMRTTALECAKEEIEKELGAEDLYAGE